MQHGSGWGAGAANGSYDPPSHTNSMVRGEYSRKEGAGVGFGLSSLEGFDSENHGPTYCYERDPLTGNATERIKPYISYSSERVTEKGVGMTLF